MSRPSRRELQRELDALEQEAKDEVPSKVIFLTGHYKGPDEAPHPELAVPAEEAGLFKVAAPHLVADEYLGQPLLTIVACGESAEWGPDGVRACELWEALSDDELREEYQFRTEIGDHIPPLLDAHASSARFSADCLGS